MIETRKFRPDIEGLRAIAVLMVVLYHAGVPFLRGGYVGVDVFFVISGFLITASMLNELAATGSLRFGKFYARRARRLIPLAAVVTIATTVMAALWSNASDARNWAIDGLFTTFFSLNIKLAQEAVDYQSNASPSPFQHYWSLAVEEQFYFLWPILLVLLTLWWVKRTDRNGRPWLLMVGLSGFVAASLIWCVIQTATNQPYAYFLIPARAWELGAGALIAVCSWHFSRLPRLISNGLFVIGIAAIISAGLMYTDATAFPGVAAILPVAGTAMVIVAGLHQVADPEFVLRWRPLQYIGKVSYGWYLWHWPLLVLLPLFLNSTPTLTQRLVVVLLALWLAAVSYVAFEGPVRHLSYLRPTRRSLAMAGTFVAAAVITTAAVPLWLHPSGVVGAGVAQAEVIAVSDTALTQAIESGEKLTQVPGNLSPTLTDLQDDLPLAPWSDGVSCMVQLAATSVPGSCRVAGTEGPTKVLLTGDSHAYQWAPALIPIARESNWELTIMTKSGCPLYDVPVYSWNFKRDYTECYEWRADAMDRIRELDPDLIVTSAFIGNSRGNEYTDAWIAGTARTVEELQQIGGSPVVAIADTPWPEMDMRSCLVDHLDDVQECSLDPGQSNRDVDRAALVPAAAGSAGAVVVDPTTWLCAKSCPAIIGNTPVYSDDSHLSATMSAKLRPVLAEFLPDPRQR